MRLSGKQGAPDGVGAFSSRTSRPEARAASLRVLHLDAGRDWRGGQRQVFLLAQGMRADGHEPLVVGAPESPLVHRLRARGLAASAIAMRGDWDLAATRRLRALIRTWRPDVVHAHDARAHAIAMAALVGRPHVPLVVTRRVPIASRGLGIKYGRRVTRFIAISGAVRDALVRSGVAAHRIEIVHAGVPAPVVDHPRDWRAECRWPAEAVLCGVVGAADGNTEACGLAAIARRLPAATRARARLLVLGGGGGGSCCIAGVEAFRAGHVDEVHAAIAGLDVLWHPSSMEGLRTGVIDAMALGVPPVASAVGALPELIEHGKSGFLAPAGDPAAFAGAAARLIDDASLRACVGEGGRTRARDFDVRRMVDATARVYRDVVDAGR